VTDPEPLSVDGDVTYWTQAPAGQMPKIPTHIELPNPAPGTEPGTEPGAIYRMRER